MTSQRQRRWRREAAALTLPAERPASPRPETPTLGDADLHAGPSEHEHDDDAGVHADARDDDDACERWHHRKRRDREDAGEGPHGNHLPVVHGTDRLLQSLGGADDYLEASDRDHWVSLA
jgi:hypothetical protein